MAWRVIVDLLTLIYQSWARREVMIRMSEHWTGHWSRLAIKLLIIFERSLLFLPKVLLILLKLLSTWNLGVKRQIFTVLWLLDSVIRLHDMHMMEI